MHTIIKITTADIQKLVGERLKLNVPFTVEIVPEYPNITEEQVAAVAACVPKAVEGVAELPPPRPHASLDSYDWSEVFGEGTGGNCTPIIPSGPPGSDVLLTTFSRADVSLIRGIQEGENDGPDWIVWGVLEDGRYFIARGGCDYTGWDCQASNSGNVANTELNLITYGMSEDERKRFNLSLPGDDKTKPVTSR